MKGAHLHYFHETSIITSNGLVKKNIFKKNKYEILMLSVPLHLYRVWTYTLAHI